MGAGAWRARVDGDGPGGRTVYADGMMSAAQAEAQRIVGADGGQPSPVVEFVELAVEPLEFVQVHAVV